MILRDLFGKSYKDSINDRTVQKSGAKLIIGSVQIVYKQAHIIPLKYTYTQSARNVQIGDFALTDYQDPMGFRILRRKRVNVSTLSLTSIRLVRHRINGVPQFPSTLYRAQDVRSSVSFRLLSLHGTDRLSIIDRPDPKSSCCLQTDRMFLLVVWQYVVNFLRFREKPVQTLGRCSIISYFCILLCCKIIRFLSNLFII